MNTQINATVARQQLLVISNACIEVCNSSLDACFRASEPSFGNSLQSCNIFVSECITDCNKVRDSYLSANYPINTKYRVRVAYATSSFLIPVVLFIAFVILFKGLSVLSKINSDTPPRNIPIAIGSMLGLIVGIFGSIGIRYSLLPPLGNFPQNNSSDMQAADIITSILSIPLVSTCIVVGAAGMTLLDIKAKKCILHAYERGLCAKKNETNSTTQNADPTNRQQLQMV